MCPVSGYFSHESVMNSLLKIGSESNFTSLIPLPAFSYCDIKGTGCLKNISTRQVKGMVRGAGRRDACPSTELSAACQSDSGAASGKVIHRLDLPFVTHSFPWGQWHSNMLT